MPFVLPMPYLTSETGVLRMRSTLPRSISPHVLSRHRATSEHFDTASDTVHTTRPKWVKGMGFAKSSIVRLMNKNFVPTFVSRFAASDTATITEDNIVEDAFQNEANNWSPSMLQNVDVYKFHSDLCITHPTIQLMITRKRTRSLPNRRRDGCKLGLVIEGGGMRGAVSGAMCMELRRLGFFDVFDAVYGSSAGAINGAYFLTGHEAGMDIYLKHLTSKRFIDFKRIFSSNPVLDLNYLIDDIMEDVVPLDWDRLMESEIPLKIIASSLDRMTSVTLGPFENRDDLATALRASCTVPEIVGPPEILHGQRLVDAAVFEPIPYRAAIQDGCTHVLALCSRPRPRGARGRVRRAIKQILDKTIKHLFISPPYMEGAWKVEVEEMLKAGGMNADDLMLLTMIQGLYGMQLTPVDGHIFAVYPSPKHIIPPTTIDGQLLETGATDARKTLSILFKPLANNMEPSCPWLFV